MTYANRRQIPGLIEKRENFEGNSLSGEKNPKPYMLCGQLNEDEREKFYAAQKEGITYVVVSYQTPIAWETASGVYKVSQRFSPTTTKHMGLLYLFDTKEK